MKIPNRSPLRRFLAALGVMTLAFTGTAGATPPADSPEPGTLDADIQEFASTVAKQRDATSRMISNPETPGYPASGSGFYWVDTPAGKYVWLGAYKPVGNLLEWCVNMGQPHPTDAGQVLGPAKADPAPGILGDMTVTPIQMGWIFYAHPEDDATTRAAIAFLAHANFERGEGRQHVQAMINDILQNRGEIRTRAQDLVKEARANAAVAGKFGNVTFDEANVEFKVEPVGLVNESGAWVSGVPYTGTITSGSAVFENGKKTVSGTTTSSGMAFSGHATASSKEKVVISWSFDLTYGVPNVVTRPVAQDTLRASTSSKITGETPAFPLSFNFQPLLSSKVASEYVPAGGDFVDTISIKADPTYGDGKWMNYAGKPIPAVVDTHVYYAGSAAPVAGNDVPADAVEVGKVTSTFEGPGDIEIKVPTEGEGGYFVAKSTFQVKNQPANMQKYFAGDATYQWGLPNETSIMQVTPSVTTKASDKHVVIDDETSDNVTVHLKEGEKWPKGATLEAKGTRFGPFDTPAAQAAEAPAGAPIDGTATVTFDADGQTQEVKWTPTKNGVYTWQWEIVAKEQANPALWAADFKDDFMIPAETTIAQWEIEHSSEAREYNVATTGRAFDTVNIAGLPDSHGDYEGDDNWLADVKEARVVVYDAGKTADLDWATMTEEIPETAKVHWETKVVSVNGVFRIGYDDKNPITDFEPGHDYVFVYHFEGDDRVKTFHSPFNDVLERFGTTGPGKTPPTVSTKAQESTMVGEPFGDTAIVRGDVPKDAYLIFEAFYGDGKSSPKCDKAFFTSESIPVAGPGSYESPRITATQTGDVYWVETLFDKDGKELHKGECGIPNETTKVIPYTPHIKTQAHSEGDRVVGVEIWDELIAGWKTPDGKDVTDAGVVPWPYPIGSTTTVELFHAAPGKALVCSAEQLVGEDSIDLVEGTTKYTTKKWVADSEGTWGFVETTKSPEGELVSRGTCGDADETISIENPSAPPCPPGSKGTPDNPCVEAPREMPKEGDNGGGGLAKTGFSGTIALVIGSMLLVAGGSVTAIYRSKLKKK